MGIIGTFKQDLAPISIPSKGDRAYLPGIETRAKAHKELHLYSIHKRLKTVGPKPTGPYVYVWSHDGVPRYVGKSEVADSRWAAHLAPMRNDFPVQRRYFEQYRHEMTCCIKDGLSVAEVAQLEIDLINQYGFLADGTGTLLNAGNGSVVSDQEERSNITGR
jgi:hypothetical protein